jgi:hypothetical protein
VDIDCSAQSGQVLGGMAKLVRDQLLCDVTISVRGVTATKAHAVVLASSSEFFRRAIIDEKARSRKVEVSFEHATVALVVAVVESLYTGRLSVGEEELVDEVELVGEEHGGLHAAISWDMVHRGQFSSFYCQ